MIRYQYPPFGVLRDVCKAPTSPIYPSVRVRVKRSFYGLRRKVEPGEVVQLAEPDAINAVALGWAERV